MHVRMLLVASAVLFAAPNAGAGPGGVPLELEFRIDSPRGLGQTATLTASVSVDYDLPNVSVEIELPDGGKLLDTPATLVSSASPEEPVVLSRRVVFSKPGPKLIRAVARAEERPGVIWSCVKYVAVDVGQSAARLIGAGENLPAAVEMARKGDGISRGRPGPAALAKSSQPDSVVLSADDSPEGVVPAADHPLVVGGRWMFYDRSNTRRGIAFAEVKLFRGSDGALLASADTDANGSFLFPIIENPGAAGVFVRVYCLHDMDTENPIMVLVPDAADWWSGTYGADSDVLVLADGTRDIGSWTIADGSYGEQAWWILDDVCSIPPMLSGWEVHDLRFYWSPTNTDGSYTSIGDWAALSFNIHLLGGDIDDTPDAVLHQVGHAYRWDNTTVEGCATSMFAASDEWRAFEEGWADLFAMWATGSPVKHYPGGGSVNLETPTWGDGGATGETVRGRVAGALWDLGDAANEGFDVGTLEWSSVRQRISNYPTVMFFSEFWDQWVSNGYAQQDAIACFYQNTIDYNTPPVFNALPGVVMDEDADRENAINLRSYASDGESTDEELLFAIVGTPPSQLGMSIDENDCVDVHPAANWYGSSNVTISCSDAIETRQRTFLVTVNSVNDFPKWKSLPDITTQEDTPRSNAIHLPSYASDVDDAAADLEYAIVNTPDPGCGVTLDASNYIDINPASNWYGSTSVSVQVSDPHGLAAADVFTVTVTSVNDTPVISGLPNRTLAEDTSLDNTIDLWAYASDVETSDANLQFSISNNTDSRCGVSIDSKRYIDIKPDADWDGVADVTIRARDSGGLYDEDTFRVTVTGTNDPPKLEALPDVMAAKTVGGNDVFDLDLFAADPESSDAQLTFTITSSTDEYAGVFIDPGHCVDVSPKMDWTGFDDVTVRVTDPYGLWDEETFRVVVANLCPSIAVARANPDGTWVGLTQRRVSANFGSVFYMQDPGRMAGIGATFTGGPAVNRQVMVAGPLSTSFAERRITPYLLVDMGDCPPVRPLVMNNGDMGGAAPDASTPAVPPEAAGAYNVGLLVRTTGKVMAHVSTTAFYLWDGSAVIDSRPTTQQPWLRVAVPPSGWRPPVGSWVTVTGISGAGMLNLNTIRNLRPRSDEDIVVNAMRVAYVWRSNQSEALLFKSLLDANGLHVRLVNFAEVPKMDWSDYQAIIVGNDTGPWTFTDAKYAASAGLPVVGIGAGGVLFFEEVSSPDLYLGTANSVPITGQTMVVVSGGDIYSYPYTLPSTPGTTIAVANSPGINAASLSDPGGATLHMLRQYTDGSRYVLAGEGRFYQWGLYGQPDKMTEEGRQLFVNLIYRAVRP